MGISNCSRRSYRCGMKHLQVFLQNGYSLTKIKRTFAWFNARRTSKLRKREEQPIRDVAVIPYCQTVNNRLASLLSHCDFRTTSYLLSKIKSHLRPLKDSLGLKVPGVHRIPCECGTSYVGQPGRLINIQMYEHKRHIRLGQLKKSVLAQQYWTEGDQI